MLPYARFLAKRFTKIFKRNLAPLFKVKRAIREVMDADPKRLVIDKINKKVFNVDGSDLQLICTYQESLNGRIM